MDSHDAREMLAGSLGGASACIIEYPMDTIKVRLQDGGRRYTSVWGCVRNIAKEEGAVYGTVLEQDTEPYVAVTFAGAVGGLVVSQVLTPAELIKCRMQVQNTLPVEDRIYKNSVHCAKALYARRGIPGLFRGHVAMLLREAIGCGLYFLTFQFIIRNLLSEGQKFSEASPLVHFLGGGCAGVAFWSATYPIDAVKTKQQTMKADYLKLSFRQCVARLYRTEGMRGLFRGYGVTALRAFPGNAVLIAVYEQVNYACEKFLPHHH